MAANTDPRLQNQVIYSIYVRNHTSEGTFRAVIPDLDRIRALDGLLNAGSADSGCADAFFAAAGDDDAD